VLLGLAECVPGRQELFGPRMKHCFVLGLVLYEVPQLCRFPPAFNIIVGRVHQKALTIDETTMFDSSDFPNTVPRFTPENRKANQALVDLLEQIARRRQATPAQIAL